MTFSVIVPVYNSEKFLHRCVDSIIGQTFRDYELILVDDGSTDSSPYICDEYAEKDNRIIVVHSKNGGVVSARKCGISHAHGEYIVWVDSDDYISENYLELFAKAAEENGADMISCGHVIVDGSEKITVPGNCGIYRDEDLLSLKDGLLYNKKIPKPNLGSFSLNLWAKAIKTNLAVKYQLSVPDDIRMGEDIAVIIPLLYECMSIEKIPDAGYFYQNNISSMSHKIDINEMNKSKSLVAYLGTILPDKDEYKLRTLWYYFVRRFVLGLIENYPLNEYRRLIKQNGEHFQELEIDNSVYNTWSLPNKILYKLIKRKKFSLLFLICRAKTKAG